MAYYKYSLAESLVGFFVPTVLAVGGMVAWAILMFKGRSPVIRSIILTVSFVAIRTYAFLRDVCEMRQSPCPWLWERPQLIPLATVAALIGITVWAMRMFQDEDRRMQVLIFWMSFALLNTDVFIPISHFFAVGIYLIVIVALLVQRRRRVITFSRQRPDVLSYVGGLTLHLVLDVGWLLLVYWAVSDFFSSDGWANFRL